ncbi:MAG: Hsp20/alpha crystallin family protein [Acidobacteria bacterium]|nr:MAG: Hsp20/alpha crystallin family protein [Acidobacteriota bacterium]
MMRESRWRFLAHSMDAWSAEQTWQPRADVLRSPEGWLVKIELAGVRQEDVRLAIRDNRLHISGVRRDTSLQQGFSYYSLEMAYSRFERIVEFPCGIDPTRVSTEYRDGILYVKLYGS